MSSNFEGKTKGYSQDVQFRGKGERKRERVREREREGE